MIAIDPTHAQLPHHLGSSLLDARDEIASQGQILLDANEGHARPTAFDLRIVGQPVEHGAVRPHLNQLHPTPPHVLDQI